MTHLSRERLAEIEKDEKALSAWLGADSKLCVSIRDLLATIRRRDELIRWLVRTGCHRLRDFSELPNVVGEESAQNATDVLAIVEAGDG